MDESNDRVKQINDKCPFCIIGTLQYKGEFYPYTDEHLSCNECDGTYTLNYKPLWTEDVQSLANDMLDVMEKDFEKRGIVLSNEKIDEVYKKLTDFLDYFSTGDYKRHL